MKSNDAPRILSYSSWSAAVLATAVFAISLGIFFYQKANAPIEAAKLQGTCSEQEKVAINNYPGKENFSSKLPHEKYENLMDDNWRCSLICVPGYDNTRSATDQSNVAALQKLLGTAKIGEQPINFVTSSEDFLDIINEKDRTDVQKGEKMMRTVIASQAKKTCEGAEAGSTSGGSVDYDEISTANGDVITPVENNERQITAMGPEQPLGVPVGSGKPPRSGNPNSTTEIDVSDFETCVADHSAAIKEAKSKGIFANFTKESQDNILAGEKKYNTYLALMKRGEQLNNRQEKETLTQAWVDQKLRYCTAQLRWLKDRLGETDTPVLTGYAAIADKVNKARFASLVVRGNMLFSNEYQYIENETIVYVKIGNNVGKTKIVRGNFENPTRYSILVSTDKKIITNIINNRGNTTGYIFGYNTGGKKFYTRNILSDFTVGNMAMSASSNVQTGAVTVFIDLGKATMKSNYISGLLLMGGKNLPPLYENGQSEEREISKFKQIFGIEGDFRDFPIDH